MTNWATVFDTFMKLQGQDSITEDKFEFYLTIASSSG